MSEWFQREVAEQPDVLARLLQDGRGPTVEVARAIRSEAPRFAVIAARGTSDNAARYAQYLLGVHNRLVVALSAPSLVTQYGATPALGGALVIGMSQSGQSPDVVAVVREGRRQGAITLAITNDPASTLARTAAFVLPLHAGPERAVAATKTYTAELMVLAMLSVALDDDAARWEQLSTVPQRVREALELNASSPGEPASFREYKRLLVVGRGYNLATVFEIALKIKETCYVMADPYSSADLLHGPAALLDQGLPVLVVAPAARRFEDLDAVVRLARERRAPLIALSDSPSVLDGPGVLIPIPPGIPEWLSPIVAVVPGQVWASALASARGLDPDAPRGLSKVTLTQ